MRRLAPILLLVLAGCPAEPRYPYEAPGNRVSVRKTASGFMADITVTSDTNAHLKGLKVDRTTGNIECEDAEWTSNSSNVLDRYEKLMVQYIGQQRAYADYRAVEWAGFNTSLSTVASAVGPIAQSYIAMRGNAAARSALRPSVISEVLGLVRGGSAEPVSAISAWDSTDPEIAAALRAALLKPAASQPSK